MKRTQIPGVALVLVLMLLVACAPQATPAPQAPAAPAPLPAARAPAAPATPAKPAWQEAWDKIVQGATREGKVVIYSSQAAQVRTALQQGFKSKYGVTPEFITGATAEMGNKIQTERRVGLRLSDVAMVSGITPMTSLKPAGVLESMDSALILPEVTDLKNWLRGELRWMDASTHTSLAYAAFPMSFIATNTDLVKPGEIQTYRDLLNPKWKGKMTFQDPTLGAGAGLQFASAIVHTNYGWDFMRELAKQEPLLIRDVRQQAEWVARGKYAFALAPRSDEIFNFRGLGLPVTIVDLPNEGFEISATAVVNLLKDQAHPNAARMFLNWLLSKEGQTVFSKASGLPSPRLDVSDEGLLYRRSRPDVNYTRIDTEEAILRYTEDRPILVNIFTPR